MKLINTTRGCALAENVETAGTFFKRLVGLMGRRALPEGSALYLSPCNQIHTFFMRFAIDAAFVDEGGKILHIAENLKPWRISPWINEARGTYEFPAGALAGKADTGDILSVQ
ncbi:MAG: DUF192 domain-containing protein [Elusimicrobiales bacterium]